MENKDFTKSILIQVRCGCVGTNGTIVVFCTRKDLKVFGNVFGRLQVFGVSFPQSHSIFVDCPLGTAQCTLKHREE